MTSRPQLPRSRASDWKKVERRGRERRTEIDVRKEFERTGRLPSFARAKEESELQAKFDAGWDPNSRPARRIRRQENAWTTYKRIGQIISDGRTSGQHAGATGLRLSMVATAGGLRPRKLSQRDYEAGHTDPQKAAILRVGKKIARRKAKKASDERRAALDKNVSYGGHAMDDLHQGIKTSPRDGGGAQDPDKSPGTLKPITLGKIKRKPESATGSLSQSIKHGELVKKAGRKAATMARGEYAAGLERGGITFKPGSKTAILAKRSRTQKAAEGIRATLRTGKHAAAQATGSKTGKAPRTTTSTTRRRRVKAVSQARRGRAGTYGDPKKGYKVFTDDILSEVSPPGWGHTKTGGKKSVKVGGTAAAMKKAKAEGRMPGVKNIFSLMWAMKKRGDKPHYKPGKKGVLKKKYKKKKK